MTPFTATALKHDLSFKKVGGHGLEPAEKLLVVFRVLLSEVRPLPAEVLRGLGLVFFDLAEVSKPRHASHDLIFPSALLTCEHALDDLVAVVLASVSEQDVAAAGGARE